MEYHIRTEDLSKTYKRLFGPKNEALKSLSIEVPAGTVMGFLGQNGAGKTTTIKILLGLVRASSGKAEVMGKSVVETYSRKEVAYMPELPSLSPRDTPVDFLRLVGRICHMEKAAIQKRIPEVLNEVGLTGKERVRFSDFSKGMKQRAELAQALLPEPRLLILDEPFSGLDPGGRREIRNLIMRYKEKRCATVFFSSHILADVETLCDSIGILDKGELKVVGLKDDLLGLKSIEVSASSVDPTGMMFLEKMAEQSSRDHDRFSVFLNPSKDVDKVKNLFEKYGGQDIKVRKHCKDLEEFFMATVGTE